MYNYNMECFRSTLGELEKKFKASAGELLKIRELASVVAGLIEEVSPHMQESTSVVCPHCTRVCCINRHSYHEYADLVYILALGEKAPSYKEGISDTDPCQFLGERGCTIKRSLRPYRCNWYFCTPLLEDIQSRPARTYRAFAGLLRNITEKRELMLEEFSRVAGKNLED
jgi:hypothetical protein